MGYDFSEVRLHQGARANQFNAAFSARAFTYRNHIWLGPDESPTPTITLAHELSHVMQQTRPDNLASTGVSAAPALIQRKLSPPGNCIQGIHDGLQRAVKAWCDHASGRECTGAESCSRLQQKIRRNQLCAQHRRTINDQCYEGGDSGHQIAERDARRAQANCMAIYREKCQREPDEEGKEQVEQGTKPADKSEEKKQSKKVKLLIVDGDPAFQEMAQRLQLEGEPGRDWIVVLDAAYFDERIKHFQNEQMRNKLRAMQIDPRGVPFLQLSAPFAAVAPYAAAIEVLVVAAGLIALAVFLPPILAAGAGAAGAGVVAGEGAVIAGSTGITATTSTGVTLTLIQGGGGAATTAASSTGAIATIAKGTAAAAAIVSILLGGSKQASAAEIEHADRAAQLLLDKPIFGLFAVDGKMPAVGATVPAGGKVFKVALRCTSR